jgi:hypothetical protein
MNILLLAGPGGVGKSTTARAIVYRMESLGRKTVVLSFAGPLYKLTAQAVRVSEERLRSGKEVPLTAEDTPIPSIVGRTPRQCLQKIGESFRQNFGGLFWVDQWLIAAKESGADIVIADDARHPEEYALGTVIELARGDVHYACDHASSMPPDPKIVWSKIDIGVAPPDVVAALIVGQLQKHEFIRGQAT